MNDYHTKAKFFLYRFDFIGAVPQFRILTYDSYKNVFSTILSITIIISSIGFTIYSIIDYIQFSNPSISYLKKNDNDTIFLKNNLFMFKVYGECNYPITYNLTFIYNVSYVFGDGKRIILNIEPCEIGKNINIQFKDDLEKKYKDRINEFYCISSEHGDLSLYYKPSASSSRLSYINIDVFNDVCTNNHFYIELITENDIIDHYNLKNPIIPSSYYYKSHRYGSNHFVSLEYNFEFIKYEDDKGYFFQNSESFVAVGMKDITHDIDNRENQTFIATIKYEETEKNSSHYKRSYVKIQTLLAEIMTIVNILIAVGKKISIALLQKKMNKDIVRTLLNRSFCQKNGENLIFEKNKKEKRIFNNTNEIPKNSDKKEINKNLTEKSNIKDFTKRLLNIRLSSKDIFYEKALEKKYKNKGENKLANIWKKINFFEIIKSYFNQESKTQKLIE